MLTLRSAFFTAAFVLVTAWSSGVLADVAPPDQCSGGPGTACNNAGPSADQPGVCASTTCPHTGPGEDGGIVTTETPCVLCGIVSEGLPGRAPPAACASSIARGEGGMVGAMLLVGLGLLVSRRRRRG